MKEWHKLTLIIVVFLSAYYIPFGNPNVAASILEAFHMLQEYAREHVLILPHPCILYCRGNRQFYLPGGGAPLLRWWCSRLAGLFCGIRFR
jgi:hypothetical protein